MQGSLATSVMNDEHSNSFLEDGHDKEQEFVTAWVRPRKAIISLLGIVAFGCCFLAVIAPRQSSLEWQNGNSTINLAASPQRDCSASIDGGGWALVRHAGPNGWGPWNDNLAGTAYLGPVGGPRSDMPWTIPWSGAPSKFLFSFADCSKWLMTTGEAVNGEYYANAPRQVLSSSGISHSYTAKWYNRQISREDPWISIGDHPHGIVYGESGWNSCHYAEREKCLTQMKWHGGANVYIKWD